MTWATRGAPTTAKTSRSKWSRYKWWMLGAGVLGVGFLLHVPTRDVVLPDGRHLVVIQAGRQSHVRLDPETRSKRSETRLFVEYYTDERDVRLMRREAQTVGPAFFKLAAANDLQVVVVKASRSWPSRSLAVGGV